MNAILPTARKHKPLAAFLTLAAALLALSPGAKAALTPTYYFNASGSARGTWKDGSGKWANCASTAYYFWQTNTASAAPTGVVFGAAQSTAKIQFGGTTTGTAGTVTVHSSKMVTVGAMIFAKPNSGQYTITQGTGSVNPLFVGVTNAGVADAAGAQGSGNYGIIMNSDSPTVTFTNTTDTAKSGIKIVLTQAQKWVNNNTTSTNSLNVYGNIEGNVALTTYGNILLGGSNAFGSLAVGSGTTTVDNSTAATGNTVSAGNSLYLGTAGNGTVKLATGSTLVLSASTNATTFATSTNGNLVIGTGGVLTITNSGSGAANNAANGGVGTANLTVTGGKFINTGSGTLTVGSLTLGGSTTLTYGYDSPITSTNGTVAVSSTANMLNITGAPGVGTYTLINGLSFSGLSASSLSVTGTALGNATVPYGTTGNVGRSTYQITSTATALQLVVEGGAFNLNWTGASNNNWTTNTADVNWATVVGATEASFYNNDNVSFTNAATVTVDGGGVTPGSLTFSNASGSTVELSGGNITASSVSMTGTGTATVANTTTSSSAVTAGSGGNLVFSGPLTVSSGGLSATTGGTVQINGATTVAGGVTANGGTVILGSGASISGSTITVNNGGTLNANDANTAPAIVLSSGTVGGSGTLTATSISVSGTSTISANLAGSGAINSGSGTTTISGNNTGWSGNIATTNAAGQSGGIVQLGGANAAAGSGVITILTNNSLDLNGQTLTKGMNLNLGSAGNTANNVYGGLINNSTNDATFAGDVYVNSGAAGSFAGSIAVGLTTNAAGANAGNTTNGGGITLSGNVTIGSRGLTKIGLGTLTLTGTGNAANGIAILKITDGTVYFPTAANLSSDWTINSGGSLSSTGAMLLGGDANAYNVAGFSIGGIMSINETGAGTATINLGNGVITGGSSKQINVGSNAVANFTGFELGLTQSANRTATFGVDGTVNFNGVVKGDPVNGFTAGFIKSGTGTVNFNAANTYSGPTVVSNGVVAFTTLPALNGDGSTNALGSAFGVNPLIILGGSNNTTTLAFKGGARVVDDGFGNITTNVVGGLLTNEITLSGVTATNVIAHEGSGTLTVAPTSGALGGNGGANVLVLGGSNANKISDATAGPGIMAATFANGSATSTVNPASYTTAPYTAGATVITVANASQFAIGAVVNGTGIVKADLVTNPSGTTIVAINGNEITLSLPTTSLTTNNGNTITFSAYADGVTGLNQIAVTNGANTAAVGSSVSGSGIQPGTVITAISTNNIYTLSQPTTNAASYSTNSALTFGGLSSLTKTGSSTWTLTANNTYTGATTVNGGTLAVTGSTLGSGTVSVNTSGNLSGTGSVGNVTVANGGTITPGTVGTTTAGTLTLQSVIWAPGGNYNWVLNDAGNSSLSITSGLDLSQLSSSNLFNINLSAGGFTSFNASASTNWTLANFGSISGFSSDAFRINTAASNGAAGFTNAFTGNFGITNTGSALQLTYDPTPTPAPSPSLYIGGNTGIPAHTATNSESYGNIGLLGNSTLTYTVPGISLTGSGTVTISGTNNLISLPGGYINGTTNVLLAGANLTFTAGASLAVTGSAVGNETLPIGQSYTNSGSILSLQTNATSVYLTVTQNNDPLSQGLVAYFNGDDFANHGNASGLQLSPKGGVSLGAGIKSNSYICDGVNGGMILPDDSSLKLDSFSIGAWVKWNGVNGLPQMVVFRGGYDSGNDPFTLGVEDDGRIFTQINHGVPQDIPSDTLHSPTGVVPVGRWLHLIATYDSESKVHRLYANGSVVAEGVCNGPMLRDLSSWADPGWGIGNHSGRNWFNYPFNGSIDEIRFYNRALSATEVGQIYTSEGGTLVAPVITLNGANPMTVIQGAAFTDPGATVVDATDGTNQITGAGTVDTTAVGSSTLTYNATNSLGLVATTITRTVVVSTGNQFTSPAWAAPEGMKYAMMVYAGVSDKSGNPLNAAGSMLAAFSGTDCLGVAYPVAGPNNTVFYPLTVYSNTEQGALTYQFYNAANGQIWNVDSGPSFTSGAISGSIIQPNGITALGGPQTITFPILDSVPVGGSVTLGASASSGLTVGYSITAGSDLVSVSGNTLTALHVGTVTVVASQAGNANWNAATPVTNSFLITQGTPVITTLPTASAISYGHALSNSVLSGGSANVPGGFGWSTPGTVPDAVGIYTGQVTFTPSSADYGIVITNVAVTVNPASATVNLGNLSQTYDGTGKSASVITVPSGLSTVVTYDGSTNLPVNAGSYSVVGVITESNYAGSNNAILTITKASNTITPWAAIPNQTYSNNATVTITPPTASSGQPVVVTVKSGPATISGNVVTLTGVGPVVLAANQAESSNYQSASEVTTSFLITPSGWTQPVGARYSAMIYAKVLDAAGNQVTNAGSMLAVFNGSNCAGVVTLSAGPSGSLFLLPVYSDQTPVNGMSYKLFNGATGAIFTLAETYNFTNGAITGTIVNPITLHLARTQTIAISHGWTWISINVTSFDNTWDSLLPNYPGIDNDVIIGTKGSATYYGHHWWPSSPNFTPEAGVMYQLGTTGPAFTLTAIGYPALTPLNFNLIAGWNWLGCPDAGNTTLREMMAGMIPSDNDLILSQTGQSATYYRGIWYTSTGLSDFPIVPGRGYLLYHNGAAQTVPLQ